MPDNILAALALGGFGLIVLAIATAAREYFR
jgi:hypothetical protein